jgi:hypothetical protein
VKADTDQSSSRSGNRVLWLRSSPNTKRVIDPSAKSQRNHIIRGVFSLGHVWTSGNRGRVGLPARDGGGVKAGKFGIWFCPSKRVADGLRVLRGKQDPHDLAAVLVMLENFLTDELTLAIAIGGEPNPLGSAQCFANDFELGGFVPALCRASAPKPDPDRALDFVRPETTG